MGDLLVFISAVRLKDFPPPPDDPRGAWPD